MYEVYGPQEHNQNHNKGTLSTPVNHTLGPIDGSLYATVNKKHSTNGPTSSYAPKSSNSLTNSSASTNNAKRYETNAKTSVSTNFYVTCTDCRSGATAPIASSARSSNSAAAPSADARKLDDILTGMLLDIQNIPDLYPPPPKTDHSHSSNSLKYNTVGATNRDSRIKKEKSSYDQNIGMTGHHTLTSGSLPHYRKDTKPTYAFTVSPRNVMNVNTYTVPENTHSSHSIERKSSRKETNIGLESPRLLRKIHAQRDDKDSRESRERDIVRELRERESRERESRERESRERESKERDLRESRERDLRESRERESRERESRERESSRESNFSRSSRSPSPDKRMNGKRDRAQTLTTKVMSSGTSYLSRTPITRSTGELDDFSYKNSYYYRMSEETSWLKEQQQKLRDRRDQRIRAERGPHAAVLMDELKSKVKMQKAFDEDGEEIRSYNHRDLNTSADSSFLSALNKQPLSHSTPIRGNSAPSSPDLSQRNRNEDRNKYSPGIGNDKERPFVAVKRLHETSRLHENGHKSALRKLQMSPLGNINYPHYYQNDRLLKNSHRGHSQNEEYREDEVDHVKTGHVSRQNVSYTSASPYANQGLPPKSPTNFRKEMSGIRSPSPSALVNQYRQETNGNSSPQPSQYFGQSRRSSNSSLNDSIEVISSHPKFVKDVSKYWYKPAITRDEAISMLRDKKPGTFVVRDSNSFPGAFGLALKVASPPPNIQKSADSLNELVRHFLIEPTSRGVRLKGCANEPVFGSLSALVYQHSITALALPCRLVLPERDPSENDSADIDSSDNKSITSQLLQQGAACNVLFLYSADTESLTGPQAVQRAVDLMLSATPTPTVVHFKVSSEGITLTDNTRQLFFRRHYPVSSISHCGLDPDDRRWAEKNEDGVPIGSLRIFGFIARKGSSRSENQCHILAELEPEQPATAICNFVTKVMMTCVSKYNLV